MRALVLLFALASSALAGISQPSSTATTPFSLTQSSTENGIVINSPSVSNGSPLSLIGRGAYVTRFASGGGAGMLTNGYITINGSMTNAQADVTALTIASEGTYMFGIQSDVGAAPTMVMKTGAGGDFLRAYNSTNTLMFSWLASGALSVPGGLFLPGTSGDNVLKVDAVSGNNAQLWLGNGTTTGVLKMVANTTTSGYIVVGPTGAIRFYNSLSGSQFAVGADDTAAAGTFAVSGNASKKGLVSRGMASQTGDLLQVQDSSSNILANVTSAGGLKAGRVISAKTADYTVLTGTTTANDRSAVFTNTGAAGAVNFTLPTAAAGLTYTFSVEVAQTLTVTATGTDTIRLAGSVSAAAGNIASATIGNVITIVCTQTGKWVVIAHEGTWTVT